VLFIVQFAPLVDVPLRHVQLFWTHVCDPGSPVSVQPVWHFVQFSVEVVQAEPVAAVPLLHVHLSWTHVCDPRVPVIAQPVLQLAQFSVEVVQY